MRQAFIAAIQSEDAEDRRGVLSLSYRDSAIDCQFVSNSERVSCTAGGGSVRFFDRDELETSLPEPENVHSRDLGQVVQLQLLGEEGNLMCRFHLLGRLPATADTMRVTTARVAINPRAK